MNTYYHAGRDDVETWIPNPDGTALLVTLDLSDVWATEFAEWESVVDTQTAAQIATAIINVLRQAERIDV